METRLHWAEHHLVPASNDLEAARELNDTTARSRDCKLGEASCSPAVERHTRQRRQRRPENAQGFDRETGQRSPRHAYGLTVSADSPDLTRDALDAAAPVCGRACQL